MSRNTTRESLPATNFDPLTAELKVAIFPEVVGLVEKILNIVPSACMPNCNKRMECAVFVA